MERNRLHKAEVERWGSGKRPEAAMLGQTSGEGDRAEDEGGLSGPGPRNPTFWWTNEAPRQLPGRRPPPRPEADPAPYLSPGQGPARGVQPWGFCSGLGWGSSGPWAAPKEGAGSPSHICPGDSAWKAAAVVGQQAPRLGNRRPLSPGSFLPTSCRSGVRLAQEGKQCCL